jgi:plastocyanin
MDQRRIAPIALVTAIFLLMAGFFVNAGAQGTVATPAAGGQPGEAPHPAHIHTGTCDTLGDVVFPLNDVAAPETASATPVASPVAAGSGAVVAESTTIVEVSLDDIISGGHAINVHESKENVQNYIACGDVTGSAVGGQLSIELNELNGSGYMGQAALQDNRDGTTTVTVVLTHIDPASTGTPVASPVAGSAEGTVAVEIKDFAFGPGSITIPVGGSVTWMNMDPDPHTATAQDRAVLQSGTLEQGDSFTQAFTTAGTYEYFCEFHPNMKGTIIVQ